MATPKYCIPFKCFYKSFDYFGENASLSHEWLKESLCYPCKQLKLSKILNPSTAFGSRGKGWPGTNIAMLLSTKLSFHDVVFSISSFEGLSLTTENS